MERYAFVLGSHPALSVAEALAYMERTGVRARVDSSLLPCALSARADLSAPAALSSLGGTPSMVRIVGEIADVSWDALEAILPLLTESLGSTKNIGISVLDCAEKPRAMKTTDVRALGMQLKRAIARSGLRLIVPQKGASLTSAQLYHAGVPERALAVVLIRAEQTAVGIVEAVQDIGAYARRDRDRPYADPGSGMLPPKVAQMLLNLSLVPPGGVVFDPFSGAGTIPVEAMLQGLQVVASDVSPKQAEGTRANLAWAAAAFPRAGAPAARVFVHDVTRRPFPLEPHSVDAIVTEGWLGPARSRAPQMRELQTTFDGVVRRLEPLFLHAASIVRPRGTIALTLPAFRVKKRVIPFPLDRLSTRAFAQESLAPRELDHPLFREASSGSLFYGRLDAVVLRQILRFRKRA